MADYEKNFQFPDEMENKASEVEEDALDIEIEDDTPEADRGRKPADAEKVKALEVDVDELDKYSKEAKDKMIQMKRIWNDELATSFGRKTRNLVDTQEYRNVFDIKLAQDS